MRREYNDKLDKWKARTDTAKRLVKAAAEAEAEGTLLEARLLPALPPPTSTVRAHVCAMLTEVLPGLICMGTTAPGVRQ